MPNRMDTTPASETRSAARNVKPRSDGLVGVFSTLAAQHREAIALLDAALQNPDRRPELWPKVRAQLMAHERAEMQELYPLLREMPHTRALAEHHDIEANAMVGMIERLEGMDLRSATWSEHFEELAGTVKHHALEEEEEEIFPLAQDALGAPRSKQLDVQFRATYDRLAEFA